VLGEDDLEGVVRQWESLANVEVNELVAPTIVVEVGVQPSRQDVLTGAEVKLADVVCLQVAADPAPASQGTDEAFDTEPHN